VDGEEPRFFEPPEKNEKKSQATRRQVRDYQTYKDRKRREIVRRCTETILLCGIGVIVWKSRTGSTGLKDWLNEIAAFLVIPPLVYVLYPLRLTLRALASGKTLVQALRLGFHIPSRFDPGPLLYPVWLPWMVAISLFHHSPSFLPAAIVCGLSSIPRLATTTPQAPVVGEYMHWIFSVLPLHASNSSLLFTSTKPLPLRIGRSLTQEDLVLLFPLHHALMSMLGYLTTSSLEISELQLLSSALLNLYLFAGTPQAEILKAMIWLGGLCIFITCKNVLMWEVVLARVPTWRLLRIRRNRGLVSQIDQAICTFLVRGRFRHVDPDESDSDDDVQPLKSIPRLRPRLKLQLNGRAFSAMGPVEEPKSAFEATMTKALSIDMERISAPLRRNTFAAFDQGNRKEDPVTLKKAKLAPSGPSAAFLSFSVEQARVRKYAYAAVAYFFVAAIILGPVRLYVATRALSNHEPIGWALGYLLGNLPTVRFWVVSNNLERWISLPARQRESALAFQDGVVENLRQNILGPANTRLAICAYCVVVLGAGIAAVLRLTSVVEVDTRRKVFHGIMVAMLLPTIYVDPCFIALALSLILAIFLLLDLFRASQLPPISKPLTVFLAPYVDGRDHRGPVIVSHIFLLIGCAIPLWLSLAAAPRGGDAPWTGWDTPVRDLSMVSGVICVGMGDAAASLIGRRYGKTKWYWVGGKSLEGSLAFAFAVTCGLAASWAWLRLGGWASWHDGNTIGSILGKCLIAGTGASLLESTLTAANDNVVVPVGLWLLVRGLEI
jgi:dolichol kinase